MSRGPSRRSFLRQSSGRALAAGLGAAPSRAVSADEPVRESRRGGMLHRRLGRTDIQVAALAFGSHTDPAGKTAGKTASRLTPQGQARRDRQVARALDAMKGCLVVLASLRLIPTSSWDEYRIPDWVKVTAGAGWRPRDSSGEVVYKDRLWLLGGWFDSFSAPPRDVWSSSDGKAWNLVTAAAPWKHSDLPMTLVFNDRMWLLGGWYNGRLPGHSASNEVWTSSDGRTWEQATDHAGWSPRLAAGAVAFRGRLWVLGGTEDYYFGDDSSLKNDVWSSADGKRWTREVANAPWSPRAYHAVIVHDGRIWVLGGGNYVPRYQARNDVWCSPDGVRWERVTEHAPWSPRIWFSAVVYRDRMWVLGGWSNNPSKNWGDVWYSRNGKDWTEFRSNVVWKARHEHSAYVFQDKIWVVGGHAQPLSSEVWSLEVPHDWFDARPEEKSSSRSVGDPAPESERTAMVINLRREFANGISNESLFRKPSLARQPSPRRWDHEGTIPYAEGVADHSPGSRSAPWDPNRQRTPYPERVPPGSERAVPPARLGVAALWNPVGVRSVQNRHDDFLSWIPRVRCATLGFVVQRRWRIDLLPERGWWNNL